MSASFWIDECENYQFSVLGQKYWLLVDKQQATRTLRIKRYAARGYSWVEIPSALASPLPA